MILVITLLIRVFPAILSVGGSVWVTCKVPQNAENRGLTMTIEGMRSHFIQLEGDSAPITHQFLFKEVPCLGEDYIVASCTIHPSEQRMIQYIPRIGCE